MSEHNSLIASYANHNLARDTVRKLQGTGFDMDKLFVVARDGEMSLESAGAAVVSTLSDLGAEQFGCIPRENIPNYEDELKVDRLLIVAHGTPDEIEQARSVIDATHPEGWDGNVGCAIFYGCVD
ncbi:MAG: hypothetical protein K8H84_12305 [Sulfuricella denitrificans]|nr:hypothetical protein [Sulfuricella denitrificans]